jgi:hypothetical protein
LQAAQLFVSEHARTWWAAGARSAYQAEARTKAEKEFFIMIENAFQDVIRTLGSANRSDVNLAGEKEK